MHRTPRLLLALAVALVAPALADDPAPSAEETAARIGRIVAIHNEIRAREKLHSLEPSAKLTKAAQEHADDMAALRKVGHDGSDGSTPAERIERAGYHYRRAGENVASGRTRPEDLMDGWMASPPHRKNILGSFSQIGVACAIDADGRIYWCVTFGLPARR